VANVSVIDAGSGAAQAIGRYFSVISFVPSTLYVVFVYILIESGAWLHSPNWGHAFKSLASLGISGIALLAFASIGLALLIHPIQFAVVQFFEGYWGTSPLAQAIRSQRIIYYQNLCGKLNQEIRSASLQLTNWGDDPKVGTRHAIKTPVRSRMDEASRIRSAFPRDLEQVMPTRLGNVLRRVEARAGRQYGMDLLQVVPHLLLIAPANHVDYVNDQRSQLDLAVRMTFISAVASATAVLFLWPYGLWVLIAAIPYALAYLSYRGSVVAAGHYGAALDTLINLDRFMLYQKLHLKLPDSTKEERKTNASMAELFNYSHRESIPYEHPSADGNTTTTSA
jgi:hypothetical protein